MSEWLEISTLEELEAFLMKVGNFHDGIVKEVHWVNRDFVNKSLSMMPYQLAQVRMLVQRQWAEPSAVEMRFENVWRVQLDTVDFVFGSEASVEMSSRTLGQARSLLVLKMENSEIAFERMRWRDASEWMGPEARFGQAIT